MATKKSTGLTPAAKQPPVNEPIRSAPVDPNAQLTTFLQGVNQTIGQATESRDAALSDAKMALAEAEALFTSIRDSIGTGQGGDPIALAEVGRRLTCAAYEKVDQASIA